MKPKKFCLIPIGGRISPENTPHYIPSWNLVLAFTPYNRQVGILVLGD